MGVKINIKQGYNQRLKERMDERATRGSLRQKGLLDQEAHYWPFESLEYAYAIACVEIVLLHSEKASQIYHDIVRAWELPDCRSLIGGFKDCLPATNNWRAKALKAREKGEQFPDWPSEWFDTYFKHAPMYIEGESHNTDWEYLLDMMDKLILVGFNRQIDQDNEAWKVTSDTSPWLKSVIILRSQFEYCKIKLEDLNKYRQVKSDGKLYDLNTIMADKPTAGVNRKIYRTLTHTCRRLKFNLKHDAKLLKDADQWYKCRVNPGSIEAYLQELADLDLRGQKPRYPDQGRVSNNIAACDDATGYPRHK